MKPSGPGASGFATTRWSLVLSARREETSSSREALETLCRTYWYPLYVYLRRRGRSADDAQDLTQEFFAALLQKGYLGSADPARGRFRAFLLTALKRFVSKEDERARAKKRGGGRAPLSFDFPAGERRYLNEPFHDWTPEKVFERRWALTLLEESLARLERECEEKGKGRLFARLKGFLSGDEGGPSYREAAAAAGLSEGSVKVAVHRLRKRYREILRAEARHTVAHAGEVDDELERLLQALRGGPR